jgi:IS5 family transposase
VTGTLRTPVERTFAMKRSYGYTRVRYRSLVNNPLQLQLLALALNLRRALMLTARGRNPPRLWPRRPS